MDELTEEDKVLLDEVKQNIISDGLRWSAESNRKIIHLWKKLKLTEQELQASSQEKHQMKQQQKAEMAGIEDFVSNIRKLQQEKVVIIEQLETDNTDLRRQVEQVTMERDAFIQDSQMIADLLRSAGLQQYMKKSPGQQIEHLIQDIDKALKERNNSNDMIAGLKRELEFAKQQLDSKQKDLEETMYHARKKTTTLEKTLDEVRESYESEMSKWHLERDQFVNDMETKEGNLEKDITVLKKKEVNENSNKEVPIISLRDEVEATSTAQGVLQSTDETEIQKLENEPRTLKRNLSTLDSRVKALDDENRELKQHTQELASSLDQEKAKMVTVKADHIKQHRMNKNQIQELKEKLAKSEADKTQLHTQLTSFEAKFRENMSLKDRELSSCASDLEDALKRNALLNADLSECKTTREEATHQSVILKRELATTESQCVLLKSQVEELSLAIEEMKEQSINILEEQLQKVHELEKQFTTSQHLVAEKDSELDNLRTKIDSMSEEKDNLKIQLQGYEQVYYDKQAWQQEKELNENNLLEKEQCIEKLEQEIQKLQESSKSLVKQNAEFQQLNCESTNSLTDRDHKIKKVTKINETYEIQSAKLQETMSGLHSDNDKLRETVKDIETALRAASQDHNAMKVQHESEITIRNTQIEFLQKENGDLTVQLEELSSSNKEEVESLNSTAAQLHDELHSTNQELNRVRTELKVTFKESYSLKESLDNAQHSEKTLLQESDRQLVMWNKEQEALKREVDSLQTQLKLKREAESITRQTIDTLQQTKQSKESLLAESKERVDLLTKELDSTKKDFTNAKAELRDLRNSKEDLEQELALSHKETANLNEKVTEFTTQLSITNSQLVEEINKKDETLNHKDSVVQSLERELHTIKHELSTTREVLANQKTSLNRQVEELTQKLSFTQAINNSEKIKLQAQIRQINVKQATCSNELESTKHTLETVKAEKQIKDVDLKCKVEELKEKNIQIASLVAEIKIQTSTCNELKEKLREMTEKFEETQQLAQSKDEEVQQMLEKIRELTLRRGQDLEEVGSELTRVTDHGHQLQDQLETKEKELNKTRNQLMALDKTWASCQEAYEKEKKRNAELECERLTANYNLAKLQEQIQILTEQNTTFREASKKVEDELVKKSSISRRIESKLAKNLKQLSVSEEERKKAQDKVAQQNTQLVFLHERLTRFEKRAAIIKDKEDRFSSIQGETDSLRKQLHQEEIEKILREQTVKDLQSRIKTFEENQERLENMLQGKEDSALEAAKTLKQYKHKLYKLNDKLKTNDFEKWQLDDQVTRLQSDLDIYTQEIANLTQKLARYKRKYAERKQKAANKLSTSQDKYSLDRMSLESSMDSLRGELISSQKQLLYEEKWITTADDIHKSLLEEKSELSSRMLSLEETVREKNQKVVEMELIVSRLTQENKILDERNKIILGHLKHRPSSPSSPSRYQGNTSSLNSSALRLLLSSPLSPNIA